MAEWTTESILELFELPLADLVHRAQGVHRANFDPNTVQLSTLMSIKTGGCSEDCGYCSQSARHDTGLERQRLAEVDEVITNARAAKEGGATRFCMGAAWRGPKDVDLEKVEAMVRGVKALGMETCVTLGMLKPGQAERLKDAGLDYYNHNLDTAPEYYEQVVTTHRYADRLDTLRQVREAGLSVCCGGIIGMGEDRTMRAGLIAQLANLNPAPESVPVNMLVPIPGTPMAEQQIEPMDMVRTIAAARITMPTSHIRLSAGRQALGEMGQALCFLAGANSIFYGEKLLTTGNPEWTADQALFAKLGLRAEAVALGQRRCAH